MIETLLSRDEGKTLEFKEDLSSPRQVVRSVVAFANTAGGTIVVGIQDRTKAVVGIKDALTQEERLANVLADCIQPQLIPDIQIHSWRDRELLVIVVPHSVGPYYLKAEGADNGVYVRLGSTNRRAGPETIAELRRLAGNVAFDELPRPDVNSEAVDFRAASEFLSGRGRSAGRTTHRTLGLLVDYHGRAVPTNGALLLFGRTRREWFPDAAKLWRTSDRTARARLRTRVDRGIMAELGTGPRDRTRSTFCGHRTLRHPPADAPALSQLVTRNP